MSFFAHENIVDPKSLSSIDLHDHAAVIYDSQRNKIEVLAELCRIGLERNELCLIVTHGWKETEMHLRSAGIDVDAASARGALIFQDIAGIFPTRESLDPGKTIVLFEEMIHKVIDQGFSGLRMFNSPYLPNHFEDVGVHLDFVSKMSQILSEKKVVWVSFYDLNEQEPDVIINAILSHPTIVLRGIVCNNFFYVPPDQLLRPKGGAVEMNRLLDSLIDVHHNQITLKQSHSELETANGNLRDEIKKRKMVEWALLISELRYKNTLDSIFMPIFVINSDYRVILTNKAFDTLAFNAGYKYDYIGKNLFEAFPFLNSKAKERFEHVFRTGESVVVAGTEYVDGAVVNLEAKLVPTMEGEEVVSIAVITRDFTLMQNDPALKDRPKRL